MNKSLLLSSLLLSACVAADGTPVATDAIGGLWVINWDALVIEGADPTCTENFDEASCPEAEEVEDTGGPELEVEQSAEGTPPTTLVEIRNDTLGNVFVIIEDRILLGTQAAGTSKFTVSWEGGSDSNRSESLDDYSFIENYDFTTNIAMELTLDTVTGESTGKLTQTMTSSANWAETDELDEDEDAIRFFGQINNQTFYGLEDDEEGGRFNEPDVDDCDGDTCELAYTEQATRSRTFTALATSGEGFPGASGYDDVLNPEYGDDNFLDILSSGEMQPR